MLLIHCDACGTRQLVGPRAVLELRDTDHGPEALVRCPAGHHVLHTPRTGASRTLDLTEARLAS